MHTLIKCWTCYRLRDIVSYNRLYDIIVSMISIYTIKDPVTVTKTENRFLAKGKVLHNTSRQKQIGLGQEINLSPFLMYWYWWCARFLEASFIWYCHYWCIIASRNFIPFYRCWCCCYLLISDEKFLSVTFLPFIIIFGW